MCYRGMPVRLVSGEASLVLTLTSRMTDLYVKERSDEYWGL